MITTQIMPKTPVRQITAKVELYSGSTLLNTFYYNDYLKSVDIDRTAEESKLFGFTVSHKATVKILDKDNNFVITNSNSIKIYFNNQQGYISPFPMLYVSEVTRDKVTGEITVKAYDLFQKATELTVAELEVTNYTIYQFAAVCANLLGANGVVLEGIAETDSALQLYYAQGANFNGNETIRQALNALAEATQTIIYFNYNNSLVIKRMVRGTAVERITTADYFTYSLKGSMRIKSIAHITELGENIEADSGIASGITYYMRNNPFLEMRTDTGAILQEAVSTLKNTSFGLYELNARGNYLIEIGDYFAVDSKDGTGGLFLVNDSIKYSGGLSQKCFFNYSESTKTHTNPSTLGETINETTAKVDKVNREIELLISETDINESKLTALELTSENITAKVENIEKASDNLNGTINELTSRVNATLSAEDVRLEIQTAVDNGTTKVETSTGYTFNDDGLTVSKSGSEMTTTITEDGMTVRKDGDTVLTANNEGVTAIDLKATTFLIIGENSRLEDYEKDGNQRTACFWIGGSE